MVVRIEAYDYDFLMGDIERNDIISYFDDMGIELTTTYLPRDYYDITFTGNKLPTFNVNDGKLTVEEWDTMVTPKSIKINFI